MKFPVYFLYTPHDNKESHYYVVVKTSDSRDRQSWFHILELIYLPSCATLGSYVFTHRALVPSSMASMIGVVTTCESKVLKNRQCSIGVAVQ